MKLSTIVLFTLVISAVFFVYAEMVREANDTYTGTTDYNPINSSEWDTKYDMVNSVNNTVSPLEEKFKQMQDPDKGFFTKLYLGISAIPYAIILIPETIFNT